MTKLCTDCKWYVQSSTGIADFGQCGAPQNYRGPNEPWFLRGPNGVGSRRWTYTSLHRGWLDVWPLTWLLGTCGYFGRWWEPRGPSWWETRAASREQSPQAARSK